MTEEIKEAKDQSLNKSTTRMVTINGVVKPRMTWCAEFGISHTTAAARMQRGWCDVCSVTAPLRSKCAGKDQCRKWSEAVPVPIPEYVKEQR